MHAAGCALPATNLHEGPLKQACQGLPQARQATHVLHPTKQNMRGTAVGVLAAAASH